MHWRINCLGTLSCDLFMLGQHLYGLLENIMVTYAHNLLHDGQSGKEERLHGSRQDIVLCGSNMLVRETDRQTDISWYSSS